MVPDTRMRLATILKALNDIVGPAIPAEATFVHEQLALICKSLAIAIDHSAHEYAFVVCDAADVMSLARDLLAVMAEDFPGRTQLADLVARGEKVVPGSMPDHIGLEGFLRELKLAIETTTADLFTDPEDGRLRQMQRLILDHGDRQTLRERSWTIATGFESDARNIPPIEVLLYEQPFPAVANAGKPNALPVGSGVT
ncbi:hypothetical protein [Novosphingobium sp. BL-52-GroH]|uniref:hypothetical protein n=1 Tax=Novosphingobium sp. BL-52-GroH TaxID=3349877 RepID=UPI00384FDCF3